MKKIKLIVYHPYSLTGGADNSLKRLVTNLNLKKFSITFVSLNKSILVTELKNKVKFIDLKSYRAIYSILKLRNIVQDYRKLNKFKKIIVFSNQNFGNIISFISLMGIKNIKKIFIDRNHLDELSYSNNVVKIFKNNLIKILIKIIYKHADLVIGISKKLSLDLSKFTNAKVKTIYSPAYDLDIIKKATKKIYLKKKYKYIINVSRFTPRKDHYTTLKGFAIASKKIKNLKLILIGYGPEYEKIKYFIKKLKIKKKVMILKSTKNPYPYIKKSNLFIFSSNYEGFPNVINEALMLNTPVISSNCKSGPKEMLLNGKGGDFYPKKDYIRLRKLIENYLKNPKKLENKMKIARKQLWKFTIGRHVKLYHKLFFNI